MRFPGDRVGDYIAIGEKTKEDNCKTMPENRRFLGNWPQEHSFILAVQDCQRMVVQR